MFCCKKTSNNWGPSGTFRGRSISPKMRPPSATTRPGQRPNALGRPSRTGDGGSSAFIHGSMEFPIWGFQWINGSVESTKFEATFFPLSLATLCNIRWIPSDFPRKRSGRSARKSSARSARKLRRSAPTRSPLRSRSLDGSSMKQCCWWVVLWEFSHLNYRLKKGGLTWFNMVQVSNIWGYNMI